MDPRAQRMLPGTLFSKPLNTSFLCRGFNFRQAIPCCRKIAAEIQAFLCFLCACVFFQLTNSNKWNLISNGAKKKSVEFLAGRTVN